MLTEPGDDTALAESMGCTREEEERLLDAGDAGKEDLDLMGLNIFLPISSMDTDRTEHSRINPDVYISKGRDLTLL